MKLPKLKWRVDPAPTGQFRSFQSRAWPSADYPNGDFAACIISTDKEDYKGFHAKATGLHLKVKVAKWLKTPDDQAGSFKLLVSKAEYSSIAEAKEAVNKILEKNPELMPKEYYDDGV